MKELAEFIIKSLVDNPKKVVISQEEQDDQIILKVSVDKNDMGRVIGKGGKIIKSVRNLLFCAAAKKGKRVQIILNEQENQP